jgi:hypothetical protein
MIQKSEITPKNVKAYIQGKVRYYLFYHSKRWMRNLIRLHIFEQINYRIKVMDKECYENGSCKMCGCETTALQMANKQCGKPCYPEMMNKAKWSFFKFKEQIAFYYYAGDKRKFEMRITKTYKK